MLILHALGAVSQLEEGLDAEKDSAMPVQWQHGDYSGEARILLWGGIGNTIAEWQPCWVVLVGTYLYILESENAKTYQRCSR
jgi:vacuolar protein sorting-associated protein 13A/C